MPLVSSREVFLGTLPFINTSGNLTIDASGEMVAGIFQIPKSGIVTDLTFQMGNIITTPVTLRVSLQTVNPGTGFPSGNYYGGSQPGTQTAPVIDTVYEVPLVTPAAVVQGDFVAIVVEFDSDVGNLRIGQGSNDSGDLGKMPYGAQFTTSWAKSANRPTMGIKYSDSTWEYLGSDPAGTIGGVSFNSGSATNVRALRFKSPFPFRVLGAALGIGSFAGGADYILYDDANIAIARVFQPGLVVGSTSKGRIKIRFSQPAIIKANRVYRFGVAPTTTSNIQFFQITFNHNGHLDAFTPMGKEFFLSTRAAATGVWTDTNNIQPQIALIADQLGAYAKEGRTIGLGESVLALR